MPLSDDELYLAKNCYGYGRWDADFWFIGPEQGESKLEPKHDGERLHARADAFRRCSIDGLCDCFEFHKQIGVDCWHTVKASTGRVQPQNTWQHHMLLLMAFKTEASWSANERSEYQRTRLGMRDRQFGETCIIELTGLSSKSLAISNERDSKRLKEHKEIPESIIESRVEHISCKVLQYKPQFVVMYGFLDRHEKYYDRIAKATLQVGVPQVVGKTVFLSDRHPLYTPYERSIQFGTKTRKEYELATQMPGEQAN